MNKQNLVAVSILIASAHVRAEMFRFNPALLDSAGRKTDLSLFDDGGQLPGIYSVDIILNGKLVDHQKILLKKSEKKSKAQGLEACLSRKQLMSYGIKVDEFPSAGANCFILSAIPGAFTKLDFNTQSLLLSIPQIYLKPAKNGIAAQTLWNDGETAMLMNYQASVTRSSVRGPYQRMSQDNYIQLSPGINIGAWRLRNTTNWQRTDSRHGKWQTQSTYAERGLYDIKSKLILGERNTSSEIFDAIPFRGIQLASDDAMVPSSEYQYSPVVRGIARTQARVEVKQDGYTIYNMVVAPGPFVLKDLTPTGSGGDLHVTIWETDGNPQIFTVPYQTPPVAVKEGYLRYGLMTGQYRPSQNNVIKTPVFQATAMYGLPWGLTAYGGTQSSNHFQSFSLGLGLAMGNWGAISTDMTQSYSQRYRQQQEHGNAIRFRYTQQLVKTNTLVTLAYYRYPHSRYSTLSEALDTWRNDNRSGTDEVETRRKSSAGLTLSQGLGNWGFFNFSGNIDTFRQRIGKGTTVNAGYSFPLGNTTVSLNWSKSRYIDNNNRVSNDSVTSLWVSIPLRPWLENNTTASYRLTEPSSGQTTHALGLSGSGWDDRLNWSVNQQYRPDNMVNRNNGSINLAWSGAYGQIGGNYSYSPVQRQLGASVNGGIVVHRHGVTFSQPLGDTVALIEAPGASGVKVEGLPGVRTDIWGYTTGSYLTPYQKNTISLDPTGLSTDVDIPETDISVVPTEGAVVPVRFRTRTGGRALITLIQSNGQPIPFGALATLLNRDDGISIVGDDGKSYMTGLPEKGKVKVKWSNNSCLADFQLPSKKGMGGIYQITAVCR